MTFSIPRPLEPFPPDWAGDRGPSAFSALWQDGGGRVLRLRGAVHWPCITALRAILADEVAYAGPPILIDFTDVTSVEPFCLETLRNAAERAEQEQRPVSLVCADVEVTATLALAGRRAMPRLFGSIDEALAPDGSVGPEPQLGCFQVQPHPRQPKQSATDVPDYLSVESLQVADACLIWLRGEIDIGSSPHLFARLARVPATTVVIDTSEVTFIDVCAMGGLMEARTFFERAGRHLVLVGVVGTVRRVVDLLGAEHLLRWPGQ